MFIDKYEGNISNSYYIFDELVFNMILTIEENVEIHDILFICGFINSEK